ncbi:MAG TPA: PIN domain-containing protein [Gaiella sp.]|nr:PIN domain-containing protein [Gaiella sp.]
MLVVDTGVLVAAAARRERHHAQCAELLTSAEPPLVAPVLVVTETAYFLTQREGTGAERAFAASIARGELVPEPVEPADWDRIEELVEQYADLGLGIVDASVVAACERLGVTTLATLDHRHFSVVRPRHCEALELVP